MRIIEKRSNSAPFIIAGPCSAETEEQVITTARELEKFRKPDMFRAGIWKPRTRPNSFEGIGEAGLPWVINAGKILNVPTAVEIANAKHVELALKAGIDVLWIGARTTVNPFAVQEIADALFGTSVPVMIKNPVNPDLELWIGAFERLEHAGITDLTAVHRGFSVYKHPKYRNVPNWEIPIALRERLPNIPIICDPSHIGGKRNLLAELTQKAMDLNFDGLMIETHPNPDIAWSDAEQQITPETLSRLLAGLILRSSSITQSAEEGLEAMREKIAVLDDRIFDLIEARMLLSEDVGRFKQEHHLTILQEEHWKKLIASRIEKSVDGKLSSGFVRLIMDAVHQESIRHQMKVMNPSKKEE